MLAIAAGVLYLYIGTDDFRIILSANGGIAVWVVECMCLAVVALCIHEMVHGLSGAKYSVDENGMTTYLGKKSWHLDWADCIDYGVVILPQ